MKLRSYTISQGRDRAPARAMLKAIGFTDEDLAKPVIGVANTWIETMPCNYNLRDLVVKVKEGIRAAGGTPMEFNTIAISDGVTMGTEGMKSFAGEPRSHCRLHRACRAAICSTVSSLGSLDHPGAGVAPCAQCPRPAPPAAPSAGNEGVDLTIMDVFEAVGANATARSQSGTAEIENRACPGAGLAAASSANLGDRDGADRALADGHGCGSR
jgi:dihydroxy-acid dehydratase